MKDLIVFAVDNYKLNQIKPIINSIKQNCKNVDVKMLTYRYTDDVVKYAIDNGVEALSCERDEWGKLLEHNIKNRDTNVHQSRFYFLWKLLSNLAQEYRYVISVDARDVVFQSDVSEWLTEHFVSRNKKIITGFEGLKYEDEDWGKNNLLCGFGPDISQNFFECPITNIGVIAGIPETIKNASLTIYLTGKHNPFIPNDQSIWNILCNTVLKDDIYFAPMYSGWACQCGTTLDPTKNFKDKLLEPLPVIRDGEVYTHTGNKFTICHQWDRVPELKIAVEERYGK